MTELTGGWTEAAGAAVAAGGRPVPWEDPDQSLAAGFGRTLGELLFRPGDFFRHLEPGGDAEAGAFALIVSTGGLLFALFWNLLLLAGSNTGPVLNPNTGALLVMMALSPVLAAANLGLGSLCLWGGVAVMGQRPGFTPVWRIYCYAQGGLALGVIPLFGGLLAALWILYLMYEGVHRGLEMSAGRALGVLTVFAVLQTLIMFLLLGSLAAMIALLGFLLFLG